MVGKQEEVGRSPSGRAGRASPEPSSTGSLGHSATVPNAARDWFTEIFLGEPAFVAMTDVIIAMLAEYPDEWTCDGYWLRHNGGGVEMWVANSVYGFELTVSGGKTGPRWLIRRRLYRAYKRWASHQAVVKMRASVLNFRDNVVHLRGGSNA